jgi:hypothetical protein
MRKLALLVLGIGILLCCSALAFAAEKSTPAAPAASITLTVDPFVNPDIATRVPMAPRCPCQPFQSCYGYPLGYDCGATTGCCTCQGAPAVRTCVGTGS